MSDDRGNRGKGELRRLRRRALGAAAGEKGQSLIEFCLLLPLLIMLVFATLELARAYVVQQHLLEAARVGARTGTVRNSTAADVQTAIETYLSSTEVGNNFSVSVQGVAADADYNSTVQVTISYNLQLFTNVAIPGVTGFTIPLSSTVTMRHQ